MTMKATATVININVIFRSVFRCFCNLLRVDADINDESLPVESFIVSTERCIDEC